MTLSSHEALTALQGVARTQHRASVLRGYEVGSPHFLLWSVIWLIGYGGTHFFPQRSGLLWLVLDLAGIGGSYLLVRSTAPRQVAGTCIDIQPARGLRFGALAAAIAGFIFATYYVMRPHEVNQFGAFPPLLMALAYTAIGLWRGARWSSVGVTLGLLTFVGYVFMAHWFMLWMAVCGSACLLLTGLWMRRA